MPVHSPSNTCCLCQYISIHLCLLQCCSKFCCVAVATVCGCVYLQVVIKKKLQIVLLRHFLSGARTMKAYSTTASVTDVYQSFCCWALLVVWTMNWPKRVHTWQVWICQSLLSFIQVICIHSNETDCRLQISLIFRGSRLMTKGIWTCPLKLLSSNKPCSLFGSKWHCWVAVNTERPQRLVGGVTSMLSSWCVWLICLFIDVFKLVQYVILTWRLLLVMAYQTAEWRCFRLFWVSLPSDW